jgi:aspartate carbamoyltransferase
MSSILEQQLERIANSIPGMTSTSSSDLNDIPKHFLSIKGLSMKFVDSIMCGADQMKELVSEQGGDNRLKHRVLASVFYEPSTRTSCSFQAAMLRLGGSVITVNPDQSSVKKGETLEDTIQTMACYCDLTVLRHPEKGSALAASLVSTKPIINAGDGTGEHPTQALLDLYTIKSELGYIGGSTSDSKMTIALLGDLKNGRTVHSLAVLLSMFPNIRLIYVSPAGLEMPEYIVEELRSLGVEQVHDKSIDEVIADADIVYVTRIQKERFSSVEEYESVLGSYVVDENMMKKAKQKMALMHPLPRLSEICTKVDSDPRAAYFRQMENGMFVRMALLSSLMLRQSFVST